MTKAFQACCGMPWHITRDGLSLILTIANRESLDIEAVEARLGRKLENTRTVTERNGVAIIPVTGPIFRYANLFSEISGATSVQVLARDFTTALNDPSVQTILLNIDSPGGEANGIAEFADMVYAGREKKRIVAYIGGYGTSAAYWIASAANEIIINESGIAGSIGTIAAIPDPAVEHAGEVVIVSSQSPRKHADPTTEQGHADIQAVLDALTDVFVAAVARNRNVTAETVLSDFGQGGLFVGQAAVAAGLVDRLGAFEETLTAAQGVRREGSLVRASVEPSPALEQLSPRSAAPPALTALTPLASSSFPPAPRVALSPVVAAPPPHVRKETPMSEPTTPAVVPAADPPPSAPPTLPTTLDAYTAQMEARIQAREEAAFARAQALFEQRIQEMDQRSMIENFARAKTMTTLNQPWALPCPVTELTALLAETPAGPRAKWMQLLNRITASGLVSFDEIGSSAEGAEAADQWNMLVNAKVSAGMSRVEAIQETARQHPELYAAQTRVKKGGR